MNLPASVKSPSLVNTTPRIQIQTLFQCLSVFHNTVSQRQKICGEEERNEGWRKELKQLSEQRHMPPYLSSRPQPTKKT